MPAGPAYTCWHRRRLLRATRHTPWHCAALRRTAGRVDGSDKWPHAVAVTGCAPRYSLLRCHTPRAHVCLPAWRLTACRGSCRACTSLANSLRLSTLRRGVAPRHGTTTSSAGGDHDMVAQGPSGRRRRRQRTSRLRAAARADASEAPSRAGLGRVHTNGLGRRAPHRTAPHTHSSSSPTNQPTSLLAHARRAPRRCAPSRSRSLARSLARPLPSPPAAAPRSPATGSPRRRGPRHGESGTAWHCMALRVCVCVCVRVDGAVSAHTYIFLETDRRASGNRSQSGGTSLGRRLRTALASPRFIVCIQQWAACLPASNVVPSRRPMYAR